MAWLIRRYHPDLNRSPEAGEITTQLNLAREILSDPKNRADYDRKLSSQATANTQQAREREESARRQAEQAAAIAREVQEREDAMRKEAEQTVALSWHCPFCSSNRVRPGLKLVPHWIPDWKTDSGRPLDELSAYHCDQCSASWLDDGTILSNAKPDQSQSNAPKGLGRVKKWFGG